ncbi:MAG: hypothetical protein M1825_000296 [Sarcosagium campestre]|nr:MAG: hypothetical protein M1825_000296 [Sarcosagium campestre]
MSLFPRFPQSEFAPIFRLLDDYNTHNSRASNAVRAFKPNFDVREVKDAYELQGELPGIEQKDVQIEFSDPHTLIVKGRTERQHSSAQNSQGKVIEAGSDAENDSTYHKVSVEDETETPSTSAAGTQVSTKKSGPPKDEIKYWVSERSVGEFHRSFSFPSRVDQDNVKASLQNGILSIVVPKAAAHQAKRIAIN